MKLLASLAGIVVAGGTGAWVASWMVDGLGWTGVPAALAGAVIAMICATAIFAAGVLLLDLARRER